MLSLASYLLLWSEASLPMNYRQIINKKMRSEIDRRVFVDSMF
jgi:hypothetical protein